ncbi:MAG: acyltransferase, partial [Candidatus Melainabacteria bacterium HGW-Melainabacteria-1]
MVKSGLIQVGNKVDTEKSCEEHRNGMIEAHLGYIDEAGRQGVQILCFEEIFTGPYFCPSQDSKWYDLAEEIPNGPTTQLM